MDRPGRQPRRQRGARGSAPPGTPRPPGRRGRPLGRGDARLDPGRRGRDRGLPGDRLGAPAPGVGHAPGAGLERARRRAAPTGAASALGALRRRRPAPRPARRPGPGPVGAPGGRPGPRGGAILRPAGADGDRAVPAEPRRRRGPGVRARGPGPLPGRARRRAPGLWPAGRRRVAPAGRRGGGLPPGRAGRAAPGPRRAPRRTLALPADARPLAWTPAGDGLLVLRRLGARSGLLELWEGRS